jgi:hypothetical protein
LEGKFPQDSGDQRREIVDACLSPFEKSRAYPRAFNGAVHELRRAGSGFKIPVKDGARE